MANSNNFIKKIIEFKFDNSPTTKYSTKRSNLVKPKLPTKGIFFILVSNKISFDNILSKVTTASGTR